MLCDQHGRMVFAAATLLGISGRAREVLRAASVLPDGVRDLRRRDGGHDFLGLNLASLTHFGGRQGWSWDQDPSTKWSDIPNKDISCDVDEWALAAAAEGFPLHKARSWAARHPMARLDAVPGYSTVLDETTFPSAAAMAEWFEELLELALDPVDRFPFVAWFAGGCILHMLEDDASPYHAKGWIRYRPVPWHGISCLRGPTHSAYEASCLVDWSKRTPALIQGQKRISASARTRVEVVADMAMGITSPKLTNDLAWAATLSYLEHLRLRIG